MPVARGRGRYDTGVNRGLLANAGVEDIAPFAKGAGVGLLTAAPDLLGMLSQIRMGPPSVQSVPGFGGVPVPSFNMSGQPLISGDPIREVAGTNNTAGLLGEFVDPVGGVAKGGAKVAGLLAEHGPDIAAGIGKVLPEGLLGMTAFHGTPHKFDKFDLKAIGTGEGAQAYGHGLYFAENPGVAGQYKKDLSGFDELFIQTKDGKKVGQALDDIDLEVAKALEMGANDAGQFPHNTVYYAKQRLSGDALARLESYGRDARTGYQKNPGHLYEVDIPDETVSKMLDWDAPLSEQPDNVRKALDGIGIKPGPKARGQTIYELAKRRIAELEDVPVFDVDEAKASQLHNEAGIPGIRFFDGSSRAKGEGTRNLVVFNPDDIKQVKRDGELVYESKSGLEKAIELVDKY